MLEKEMTIADIHWLKETYFSNPDRMLTFQKGEVVQQQGERNDRLYYIESGRLTGCHKTSQGSPLKIFSAGADQVVGIYSFFSPDSLSYTTVTADQDTVVYYASREDLPEKDSPNYVMFSENILPVVVNEIYLRQNLVVKNACEKEQAMKKLIQSEKLATLGQLAAGLAHELNNAIGVLQNKTLWMTERLKSFFNQKDKKSFYPFFLKGLEQGQISSTTEIRKRKEVLKSQLKIDDRLAKKLARIDLSKEDLDFLSRQDRGQFIENLDDYWETGLALHDMLIAATHTTHVIRSIKDLGSQNQSDMAECDIRLTFKKSLSLLSNMAKQVTVDLDLEREMKLMAREGDLIQVWVNLIKNAIESMIHAKTENPTIYLKSKNLSDRYILYICDTGPGIPAKLLPHIFQPNVTTKVTGLSFGLGLGLSIVQKLITSYGGHISVESEPGKTEFKIELPKV
ncbi:ATP-binding protein [Reichenbachiella ulvae]|uniref:histidine kinase n=1 Tax=Reichenbachiella ulvae TaxID=2980104 RepID=A0ABT3CT39_9BACT|nr:ATP-binding protein [Reichenbachiella ulvae]MCV9386871.1 ATP-binding protein [Reichenbachiella ulvae]